MFRHARQVVGSAPKEHQAGDAGGRGDQNGEFAEGIPATDVDEHDVDDVVPVPQLVGEVGQSQGDGRGGSGAEGDDGHRRHEQPHGDADNRPHDPVRAPVLLPESGGEAPKHEDEGDEGDGLDQHLGEGEIRCPVKGEQCRHAVSGRADQQRGRESLARAGQRDGGDDHDRADGELRGTVEPQHLARPGSIHRERRADRSGQDKQDDAEIERQRTALSGRGHSPGKAVEGPRGFSVQLARIDDRRNSRLPREDRGAREEHRQATEDGERRNEQRGIQAVPHRENVFVVTRREQGRITRQRRADDGEQWREGDPGEGQKSRREQKPHALVHRPDLFDVPFARKRAPQEPRAVRHGEGRSQRDADERDPSERRAGCRILEKRRKHRFLGDEPCRERDARHRQGCHDSDGGEERCLPAQAAEFAQVTRSGAMVDDADDEEQRRLEQRVREQEGDPGSAAVRVPKLTTATRNPSWLTVPYASSSLRSNWVSARQPPTSIVNTPRPSSSGCHPGVSPNPGASRAIR